MRFSGTWQGALITKALARLIFALRNRVLAIDRTGGSIASSLSDFHIGVTLLHKGERIVAILDGALVRLAGDRHIARSLMDKGTQGHRKSAALFASRTRWSRRPGSGCSKKRRWTL